jgi:hypothetical protein
MSSVSDPGSESFPDDKHHLPSDHRPLILLQGWDKPPLPPPMPEEPGGSGSGSGSEDGASSAKESGSGGSGSGDSSSQPPAPPPREPGFACCDCAFFRATGNGTFECSSKDYQRWAGTNVLVETKGGRPVVNPEKASSDWFQPATGPSRTPVPTRHNAG